MKKKTARQDGVEQGKAWRSKPKRPYILSMNVSKIQSEANREITRSQHQHTERRSISK